MDQSWRALEETLVTEAEERASASTTHPEGPTLIAFALK
jgi:hypothetical protein